VGSGAPTVIMTAAMAAQSARRRNIRVSVMDAAARDASTSAGGNGRHQWSY
jgi:hypothetical protein